MEGNLQSLHGSQDGHHGLDCVAVDDWFVLLAFLLGVAILVDDPEDSRYQYKVDSYKDLNYNPGGKFRLSVYI